MKTRRIKLISWNVNGLRAVMKKGFLETFATLNADILALQETKLQAHQRTESMTAIDGYESYWSDAAVKKGYSGVGVYSRISPRSVKTGIGIERFDDEGRILELDMGDFVFFNIYFPNGQMSQERLDYKLDFFADFFAYTDQLMADGRSIVICGDYNIAHNEIDLKNARANEKRSGFLRIERDWLDRIVDHGYVDTFRHFNPETVKYSWWSYRFKARERNAGWRIDYFFVSRDIVDKGWVVKSFIDNEIYGSDHCPVGLILEI
ncbi:MAG: exodeoxyribonuclease III [Deltaproteobacteria bacterium]|nr:MAG: exodeoxyribonuclease III [Deltaproteobacteria bacterium]